MATEILAFRIGRNHIKKIELLAKREKRTKASLCRKIFEEYIEKGEADKHGK